MNRHGFICAGCWTVDRIKITNCWPEQEALAHIMTVDRHGGGSAHNSGIDLKKLNPNLPVSTVGVIGTDADGDFLFNQALTYGIDTVGLHRTVQCDTSYTDVITVSQTGKRTFFHYTGTNDLLTPEHFSFTDSSAKILHLGLLSVHAGMDKAISKDSNGWSEVLRKAQQSGLETSIEMVSVEAERNRELAFPCLPWLDYLVVNDMEIGALGNLPTVIAGQTDIAACIKAAENVLDKGAMQLVTVHYPMGAICVTRDRQVHNRASYDIPQSLVAGTVGAGDAFASGFLYGMHENQSIGESLTIGHAVAAASLRSPNTVDAVESLAACKAFAQGFAKREQPEN
ncbi:MAG: carbohydrate kinase family protein [Granulosicoccus sp.]